MKPDLIPLSQLMEYPRNPKDHDVGVIDGLIDQLGFIDRIVINTVTGHMLAGHGRRKTLLQKAKAGEQPPENIEVLDGEWLVPVDYVSVPEDKEAIAIVGLNRSTELGGWDEGILVDLLQGIPNDLLAYTGYDGDDLDALLNDLGMTHDTPTDDPGAQVDRAAELQEKWQTERGQVWQVGRHRVMCGDSTDADDVARLLAGNEPRLMVTDPPYGVEYDQEWRSSNRIGKVNNDHIFDWRDTYKLSKAEVVYCWHAYWHANVVQDGLEEAGFELRAQIIWNKNRMVFSQGHYHWKHEPCHYAVKKGSTAGWRGDRTQTTVWDIDQDPDAPGNHSTQKPVECMARPIRNHEGDVYDPFLGSGTTLVACEQTGRVGYGMEIDAIYVAVALERLAGMGLSAELLDNPQNIYY